MSAATLLTRDGFRTGVFARDGHRCVLCRGTARLDAHHVLNRNLWADGGYRLDNGVSLCPQHHLAAEHTVLGVEELRAAAGIRDATLHDDGVAGQRYDTWGNPIFPDGHRRRGELFFTDGAQAALRQGGVLPLFQPGLLLPPVRNLSWNPNGTDQRIVSPQAFQGHEVVVFAHAGAPVPILHPDLPEGWTLATGPFLWDDATLCRAWDDTCGWLDLLDIPRPAVLYRGPGSEDRLREVGGPDLLVRRTDSFVLRQHRTHVGRLPGRSGDPI